MAMPSRRRDLSALQDKPHILNACIYDAKGKVFATYRRDGAQGGFRTPAVQEDGATVRSENIVLFIK